MLTEGLSYEEQLEDYRLVYELLKRKLRTSYIKTEMNVKQQGKVTDVHA